MFVGDLLSVESVKVRFCVRKLREQIHIYLSLPRSRVCTTRVLGS